MDLPIETPKSKNKMINSEISKEIELIKSCGKCVYPVIGGYIISLNETRFLKVIRPITKTTLCEFENYLERLLHPTYARQFQFSTNEAIDISLAAVDRTQFFTLHTRKYENIIYMGLAFVWSKHSEDFLPTESQLNLLFREKRLDALRYRSAVELIHKYRVLGTLGEACRIGRINHMVSNENAQNDIAALLSYAGLVNSCRTPYIIGYTNYARYIYFNKVIGFGRKRNHGKYVALDNNRNGNLVFVYKTKDLYSKYFLDSL